MENIERIGDLLSATAAALGQERGPEVIALMLSDLAGYSDDEITTALVKVRRGGRFFTLEEILSCVPGQWPGPEEAWALVSSTNDETLTLVAPQEAMTASLRAGSTDKVARRMAFKEIYGRLVDEARDRGERPQWIVSAGTDAQARLETVLGAVADGRLDRVEALPYLPGYTIEGLGRLTGGKTTVTALIADQRDKASLADRLLEAPADKNVTKHALANIYQILNTKTTNEEQ